ncbi:septum site-determining protein MinC [Paenibacillus selenitireducens]|uniref:Probable septum site-determining protein MinC n=1 Tax=Paenibacillus selenitireducens TaxID=1324314 RepID=A0A1T2XKL7_9BACL|nr:septum site-determining protein MinC [Paenibacillus selenitireducens]OPA80348.1 septum site-determining protein MinC [Paenibacillus selenitireducens]
MGTTKQHLVTIKGIKDGLVFLLDDQCEFTALIQDLQYKLEHTHQNILTGPIMHVDIKLGARSASDEQKEEILQILKQKGNLLIRSIESDEPEADTSNENEMKIMTGVVRSGQVLHHVGNLLFLGDVNPGGIIHCTGDIYIMGSLRGMAHAGFEGNENAIISASYFSPTQLRIADVISRPPDEWEIKESNMEFAYLQEGQMQIDKISNISRFRKDTHIYKGV